MIRPNVLQPSPSDTYPSSNESSSSSLTYLLPVLTYLFLGILATWPLVTKLRGWVPGFGDWGQNMWALWWTRKALLALKQSPFFTRYLFHPDGVTLLFHPVDVTDGLLALPLYGMVGGDVSYNLMVVLSFVLSGLGVYYLVLYLSHNRWGAMVAGLVFSLSPYHFLRLELGHLNLSSMQWIPFYILFLLKFVDQGRRRFAFLSILFMVLNALSSWYYVVACGLLSLAVVAWHPRGEVSLRNRALRAGLVLAASLIVLSPLLVPMFVLLSSIEFFGEHNPLRHSVDLLSFWVPGPPSTWASHFEDVWISYAAQHREPGASAYLGYGVLVLVGISLLGPRRKEALWWLVIGLGFAVLSLGPQLQVDGRILDVRLPYHYLYRYVPGFSITGIPGRLVVMISLTTAVLAGYGLQELRRLFPRKGPLLSLATALIVVLEFSEVPLAGSSTELPKFYHTMASDSQTYAILDFKWDANYLMHAQTVHGKPLVGGWLARLPEDQARYLNQGSLEKVIAYLLIGERAGTVTDAEMLRRELNDSLASHRVLYIIDHNNLIGGWLTRTLGWKPIHTENRDDDITVYSAIP